MSRLRHHEIAAEARSDGAQPAPGDIEAHRSPGLKAALSTSAARPGCRVLDLGPLVSANLACLAPFASHVSIADLGRRDGGDSALEGWREKLAAALGPYDLVLVWDFLNHLDRREGRELVDRLSSVTRPGAVLFLLFHEGPEIPACPMVYEILNDEWIRYRQAQCGSIAAPTIPPAEVARLLAGFSVDASYLLRHGVREYVAIRAV